MTTTLPGEIYQMLEAKLGKKEAAIVSKALENGVESMQKKADEIALQKKLEVKDELSKELASKADVALVKADVALVKTELKSEVSSLRTELKAEIVLVKTELNARIDKLNIKLNFLIILMIIALTLMNPVVAEIIKNWLKI